QGQVGVSSAIASYTTNDATVPLNSDASGMPFTISNGSFFLNLTNSASGVRTSYQITIDGDVDSLNDVVARINAATGGTNLTASTGPGNRLQLDATAGFELSFSEDSGGALASFGINSFFTGEDAADIDVSAALIANPQLLAAGLGHEPGSNGTALALAGLQDESLSELSGSTLRQFWQDAVNGLAVRTEAANGAAQSSQLVRESLSAQLQAVEGVSLDEEAISLLSYQRQFQAAARFISVIDEALQTLLSIT
ncbi:MAG: flagellar basal body rod C-terminal domain-containing protein, partial [Planctomycetota bacterium]